MSTSRAERPVGVDTREAGFVAGGEALLLGVVVFVFGTLVLLGGWSVIDARFAAAGAAREAVRAAVTAEPGADLGAVGVAAARTALAAHGLDPARAAVHVAHPGQRRCAEVQATVRVEVPLAVIPSLRGRSARVPVVATHREVIAPYRSGLPAGVHCGF
jgi:hypothetical protein